MTSTYAYAFLALLALFLCQTVTVTAHNTEELKVKAAPASVACIPGAGASSSSSSCHSEVDVDDSAVVGIIRGGGTAVHDGIDFKTKDVILRFLDSFNNSDSAEEFPFHIQGWRWHFMSLMRDSRRLERLSKQLLADISNEVDIGNRFAALEKAADYVINFNMAGLFRIESQMFVKFLREHLCDESSIGKFCAIEGQKGNVAETTVAAFRKLVDKVDECRIQSEKIGQQLYEKAKAASSSASSSSSKSNSKLLSIHHQQQLLHQIVQSSRQLLDQLASMRNLQETLIVPAIARMVPSKTQKSFNSKVLRKLGLLESRLHLVGMHDAVWEINEESEGGKKERELFEVEIPYVARMMIERWRKSLYEPKAGALDYGLTVTV